MSRSAALRSESTRTLRLIGAPGTQLRLRLEEPRNCRRSPVPACSLDLELLPAGAGERVELRAARLVGFAPLRVQPSHPLQPLKGGEQRARIDLEDSARYLLNSPCDAEAVHRTKAQRFQDQHVQG